MIIQKNQKKKGNKFPFKYSRNKSVKRKVFKKKQTKKENNKAPEDYPESEEDQNGLDYSEENRNVVNNLLDSYDEPSNDVTLDGDLTGWSNEDPYKHKVYDLRTSGLSSYKKNQPTNQFRSRLIPLKKELNFDRKTSVDTNSRAETPSTMPLSTRASNYKPQKEFSIHKLSSFYRPNTTRDTGSQALEETRPITTQTFDNVKEEIKRPETSQTLDLNHYNNYNNYNNYNHIQRKVVSPKTLNFSLNGPNTSENGYVSYGLPPTPSRGVTSQIGTRLLRNKDYAYTDRIANQYHNQFQPQTQKKKIELEEPVSALVGQIMTDLKKSESFILIDLKKSKTFFYISKLNRFLNGLEKEYPEYLTNYQRIDDNNLSQIVQNGMKVGNNINFNNFANWRQNKKGTQAFLSNINRYIVNTRYRNNDEEIKKYLFIHFVDEYSKTFE